MNVTSVTKLWLPSPHIQVWFPSLRRIKRIKKGMKCPCDFRHIFYFSMWRNIRCDGWYEPCDGYARDHAHDRMTGISMTGWRARKHIGREGVWSIRILQWCSRRRLHLSLFTFWHVVCGFVTFTNVTNPVPNLIEMHHYARSAYWQDVIPFCHIGSTHGMRNLCTLCVPIRKMCALRKKSLGEKEKAERWACIRGK